MENVEFMVDSLESVVVTNTSLLTGNSKNKS